MTAPSKESIRAWMPTIAVIIGFIAQIWWNGDRNGRLEQRVHNLEEAKKEQAHRIDSLVPRVEYSATQGFLAAQISDVKKTLGEVSAKMDRFIERGR